MSSPKFRAQSSFVSVPPDYIPGTGIDKHAIEVRSKLHPFAQKNLDENVLHLFENTLVLGPHWFGHVPPEMAERMKKDAEAPLCFESTSALASHSWVSKNLSRSFPSSEVRNSSVKWVDWIDRLLPRYGPYWKRAGIYDAILLSKQSVNRDENLLAAALCFWNSASNTFDFRIGPMTPTLLDIAQIFRFRPHGRPVGAVGDYHRKKNQQKLAKPFTISPALINQNCSFSNYLRKLNAEKDKVYFPELRFPDIVLHEDQVLAQPLMSAEVPKRSIKEYLVFFRRTYPWFQPGYRLFEKEPEEEAARIDFRKKFLSVTLPRDPPHGGGKPPNFHLGAEVYHPNFCARQLGCPQLIPLKSCRSCNRASSWRDLDDLEVHKDAMCAVNKINNMLFDGWDGWAIRTGEETHKFMVQTIKDINAQVLEDPSLTQNVGGQSAQAGEVFVNSVISAGDLEFPSRKEEEEEDQAEQTPVEATPSVRRKRKETAQPATSSPSPPPSKSKRLRKRTVVEYVATEEIAAAPNATSDTDEELREAFEAVEQEKELEELEQVGEGPQEKAKIMEEEEEIPAEVIAESIALAQKQQEDARARLTSSELALFEDPEAEHSSVVLAAEEQARQSVLEPVDQAMVVPEAGAKVDASAPEVMCTNQMIV
ncbi:unnamed protein product [Prunus armeniaca]